MYAIAAALLGLIGLTIITRRRSEPANLGLVAGATVLAPLPLTVPVFWDMALRAHQKLWYAVGRTDLWLLGVNQGNRVASPFRSGFGPLGLFALVGCAIGVGVLVRRRGLPAVAVALALAIAPFRFLPILAWATPYDTFRNRFLIFPMLLAAATWGVVLRVRPLAWAAATVAVTTLALSFTNYAEKPSGVPTLNGRRPGSWESHAGRPSPTRRD
ncbi:MAG: hypothetical protein ACRDNP_04880 [Gaiellaceae bacterium]